jgi:DNA-binding MarR family transcriptional regulator
LSDTATGPSPEAAAEAAPERTSFRDTPLTIPYLLFQLSNRVSSALLEHARPLGITVPRFRVLMHLVDRDGLRICDLVRECAVEQSAMSRVVDQLEREGMVNRRPDADDNRGVTVWLTPKGRQVYESVFPHAVTAVDQVTSELRKSEVSQLIELLQRMLDGASSDQAQGDTPRR